MRRERVAWRRTSRRPTPSCRYVYEHGGAWGVVWREERGSRYKFFLLSGRIILFNSLFPCRDLTHDLFSLSSLHPGHRAGPCRHNQHERAFRPRLQLSGTFPLRRSVPLFPIRSIHSALSPGMRRPILPLFLSFPPAALEGPAPVFGQPLGRAGGPGADGRARNPR